MMQRYGLEPEITAKLLFELENEGRLHEEESKLARLANVKHYQWKRFRMNTKFLSTGSPFLMLMVGLIAGLVIGVSVGFAVSLALRPVFPGAGTNSQVMVHGTVHQERIFQIEFRSLPDASTKTTSLVASDGGYGVLALGGKSYTVNLYSNDYESGKVALYSFSLYVPSGVATFKADF